MKLVPFPYSKSHPLQKPSSQIFIVSSHLLLCILGLGNSISLNPEWICNPCNDVITDTRNIHLSDSRQSITSLSVGIHTSVSLYSWFVNFPGAKSSVLENLSSFDSIEKFPMIGDSKKSGVATRLLARISNSEVESQIFKMTNSAVVTYFSVVDACFIFTFDNVHCLPGLSILGLESGIFITLFWHHS